MSHRSSAEHDEDIRPETESDEAILTDLILWGRLLTWLVEVLDPFYQIADLLQTDHPLRDSDKPLGSFVRHFGKGATGSEFLNWWAGREDSLPLIQELEAARALLPLGLAHRWRANELQSGARSAFAALDRDWTIEKDRLVLTGTDKCAVFSKPLEDDLWRHVLHSLPSESRRGQPDQGVRLDDAIERVRSYFAPLESPLFGMDRELLAHHVRETIPREGPVGDMTPIVPLFGKGQLRKAFSSSAHLPAHLRVILHRLVRAQENQDLVTALLSTLEAVDFSIRFATGLAQGTVAVLTESDFAGDFNPTTQQLLEDLDGAIQILPQYWERPAAQAALNLVYQGRELNPFLSWAGFNGEPRLLDWMMEAEEAIRQDNPPRAAVLLSEMMEFFNSWIAELTLLCSSWDLVTHVRQDGYLQISMGRGEVWLSCKPLIDPTRYSVWLDRSELTLVNTGGELNGIRDAQEPVASLDERIAVTEDDPPFLAEQLQALVRAHEQGEILPLGRALFFGLEYLVRLHSSLAGGFLRHFFDEASLLDPVLKEGGSLEHTIYFLSYSQRIIGSSESAEAIMLNRVFFDSDGEPREFSRWLGVDGGVPGPLQGLLGWSLSLMRPDAITRLDEVRGQVERLSGLFADFLEESRKLWQRASLKTDATEEASEAIVLTFPSGLHLRGIPDVMVGPRMERGRRSVIVSQSSDPLEEFSDWEGEDFQSTPEKSREESIEEPSWPSFFDDSEDEAVTWTDELKSRIEHLCANRAFSGPQDRPNRLAAEISEIILSQSSDSAAVMFCQGGPGSGKTFLCRTLTSAVHSPLPEDYPVLFLRLDRFPQTRLSTVVERLNDHIAGEQSLARFEWTSVPLESLKSLGSEVARLADDLSALGVTSEPLANRLSSYLRQLKKLNNDRNFLLILDGFSDVPASIIPTALPPGVNLLITGTHFPDIEEFDNPYVEFRSWELSYSVEDALHNQLAGLGLTEAETLRARERYNGSLFLARAFHDMREFEPSYPAGQEVVGDLLALARTKYGIDFPQFLRLLVILGLYDRPVPLGTLQRRIPNGELVLDALTNFPSLFAYWSEPKASLGLGHRNVLNYYDEFQAVLPEIACELAESFLENPRRGDLLPALRWFEVSDNHTLIDRFFAQESAAQLWRDELSRLIDQGLFFQRVALFDAAAGPLGKAVLAGAGHLREELAWIHNARGLSLLELGLTEEAVFDFEEAIELFSEQFESGDLAVLQAMASAHSRMSEAALKKGDLELALRSSTKASELLREHVLSAENQSLQLAELRARVLLQSAKAHFALELYEDALEHLARALPDLTRMEAERATPIRGECFAVAAQTMAAQGQEEAALEQIDLAVQHLLTRATAEEGLQALILRGRLRQKVGQAALSYRDYQRALSILRYQVANGRLDLEPLLAYTVAQASLVSAAERSSSQAELGEYIEWARRRIRFEGRTDLRGLLAFLLLTRGAGWKEQGLFTESAADLRGATEQYELLSREIDSESDQPVWAALRQSFRNLTALYLSLDEPHLALICGRRALELGRRADFESSDESLELPLTSMIETPTLNEEEAELSEVRLYQLGKLYFHLGEAARRVGLKEDGATYFERAARAFAQSVSSFEEIPDRLAAEYALVLKFAAQAAFDDGNGYALEQWVDELASLPDGHLTQFDQYRFWRWSGHTLQNRGSFEEAHSHFERAHKALEEVEEHPRSSSLQAEILLDLGRVLSLQARHDDALLRLDQASQKAHDALFVEGEENRDLLVLCALHSAVAHLRSGRLSTALEQLRILVSLRPGEDLHEVEVLALEWIRAWQQVDPPSAIEIMKTLGQLSELGDWLLQTSLGEWYRELTLLLINDQEFSSLILSSARVDRILETYLILNFSRVEQDTRPEAHHEIEKLLAAKFRAFDSENRDLEAELLMGHLLPLRIDEEAGKVLLRRSEMALMRGDRGLAIIDLLRAIEAGSECHLRAHLRLAEFLQSRNLHAAAVHHFRLALQAADRHTPELSILCARFCRLMTNLTTAGVRLDLDFFREHFSVLKSLDESKIKPALDVSWLRPAREQQEWPQFLAMTLDLLLGWQETGHDKGDDWEFLEEVLDRTVLCQGRLPLSLLESFGELLTGALSTYDVQNRDHAAVLWERFINFLPGLGKRNALELLQRLFDFALRTESASQNGHTEEFLRRIEEEKRILVQPR